MSPFITNYPMTTPSTPVKKRVDRNRTYEARMATPQEIPSPDDESPILSTKKGKLASLRVGQEELLSPLKGKTPTIVPNAPQRPRLSDMFSPMAGLQEDSSPQRPPTKGLFDIVTSLTEQVDNVFLTSSSEATSDFPATPTKIPEASDGFFGPQEDKHHTMEKINEALRLEDRYVILNDSSPSFK